MRYLEPHMRRPCFPRFGGSAQSSECRSSEEEGYMTFTKCLKIRRTCTHCAPGGHCGPSFKSLDFGPWPVLPAATTISPWSGWIIQTDFLAGTMASFSLAGWYSGGTFEHAPVLRARTPLVTIPIPRTFSPGVGTSGKALPSSQKDSAVAVDVRCGEVGILTVGKILVPQEHSGDVRRGAYSELVCSFWFLKEGFNKTVSSLCGESNGGNVCGTVSLSASFSARVQRNFSRIL